MESLSFHPFTDSSKEGSSMETNEVTSTRDDNIDKQEIETEELNRDIHIEKTSSSPGDQMLLFVIFVPNLSDQGEGGCTQNC